MTIDSPKGPERGARPALWKRIVEAMAPAHGLSLEMRFYLADQVFPLISAQADRILQYGAYGDRDAVEAISAAASEVERLTAEVGRLREAARLNNEFTTAEWKAKVSEVSRVREQLAAATGLADELLMLFAYAEKGHPGRPCIRTGWIDETAMAWLRERRTALAAPVSESVPATPPVALATPDSAGVGDRIRVGLWDSENDPAEKGPEYVQGVVIASQPAGRNFVDFRTDDGRVLYGACNYQVIERAESLGASAPSEASTEGVCAAVHPEFGRCFIDADEHASPGGQDYHESDDGSWPCEAIPNLQITNEINTVASSSPPSGGDEDEDRVWGDWMGDDGRGRRLHVDRDPNFVAAPMDPTDIAGGDSDTTPRKFGVGDIVRCDGVNGWYEGKILGATPWEIRDQAGWSRQPGALWDVEVTCLGTMYDSKAYQMGAFTRVFERSMTLLRRNDSEVLSSTGQEEK